MKPRHGCLLLLPLVVHSCRASAGEPTADSHAVKLECAASVAPPIVLAGKAFDTAGAVVIPAQRAEELGGLHNVVQLGPSVISGSEPHGREPLLRLRELGVRTVVSVDGKQPEAELAAELGLRYVHVPIQYRGITGDELSRLAKTFRELDGPFYVHCFHGQHRGPAAAAVGRIVLDGVDRWTAIAEMRQYCGTSASYEGLYRAIATAEVPSAEETAAFEFAFDPVHRPEGLVGAMVALSRAHDNAALLSKRGFSADPAHPDVDALGEASVLHEAFAAACELDEVEAEGADLLGRFEAARDESRRFVEVLERLRAGEAAAVEEAGARFASVQRLCSDCHAVYRN